MRHRQTVILSTPSREANLRQDLGTAPSMSSSACCTFSGNRMRATNVPVAAEKGERVKAYVVLKPGETATEEEILELMSYIKSLESVAEGAQGTR